MPRKTRPDPWPALMADAALLSAEAGAVMMLRGWRLMAGGAAAGIEAERMVGEKVAAGFELAGALASAAARGRPHSAEAAARKALSLYGRRVRANRKRLGRLGPSRAAGARRDRG